jgi:hypothetical protein
LHESRLETPPCLIGFRKGFVTDDSRIKTVPEAEEPSCSGGPMPLRLQNSSS